MRHVAALGLLLVGGVALASPPDPCSLTSTATDASLTIVLADGRSSFREGETIGRLPPPAIFERRAGSAGIPFQPNHWCMKPSSEKFFNGFLKEADVTAQILSSLDS
jgi:hypothetical protein